MIPVVEIVAQKEGGLMRAIFVAVFIAVFSVAGLRLFWPQETQKAINYVRGLVGYGEQVEKDSSLLTVIFPDEVGSLDPFSLNFAVRQRLNNIYEPLVKLDPDLRSYGGLAYSWGMVDDLTWHFNLRPEVKFHDGSSFEAGDVVHTFELAQGEGSELAPILASVASVKAIDELQIEVKTTVPDPLLVQRVAKVLIVPSEWDGEEVSGTGAYSLAKFEQGKSFELVRNEQYWGGASFYERVRILPIIEKSKRVNTFLTDTIDLLSFVAYDAAKIVEERGFELVSVPSLEVQFLLFNLKSDFFRNLEARKALNLAIDKEELVRSVGGYARIANQFVGSGVFGFNSEIPGFSKDLEAAQSLIAERRLEGATVQLHLQKGLDVVGEHIRTQLAEVGLNVVVSYLEPGDLQKSIVAREGDLYFLGFKSDFADSMDIFDALFLTGARDNIAGYESEEFDLLVEQAHRELKPDVRQSYLKQAMKMLVMKDVVGVPLFEYENLYGFKKGLGFKPRIDGQILFDELN